MTDQLRFIAENLAAHQLPEHIFGMASDSVGPTYRQLMVSVHPDKFHDTPDYDLATEAFTKLTQFRREADRRIEAGVYGDLAKETPPEKPHFNPIALEAKGKKFILTAKLSSTDLCDLYDCTVVGQGTELPVTLKIVRNGKDNDLFDTEREVLARIHSGDLEFPQKSADRFRLFTPKVLDSFTIRAPGSQRRVHILPRFSEYRSLEEVLQVFPDGIDFRDMVWMFKRVMHGLGFPHRHKVINGALVPPHILIHPVEHGAKILDWSYAVDITEKSKKPQPRGLYAFVRESTITDNPHVKAVVQEYRDYYPPEVFEKATPTAATDIFMAAKCAIALVGGDVKTNKMPDEIPVAVQQFFLRCVDSIPAKRPQDAWDAHEELDKVLSSAVGKRKYRPFPMPTRTT